MDTIVDTQSVPEQQDTEQLINNLSLNMDFMDLKYRH